MKAGAVSVLLQSIDFGQLLPLFGKLVDVQTICQDDPGVPG